MLKFFYRLKRRGGVVLFAVIAFMTLLITMATVAYFSARASFNTVISNYDFSQMYISTTAVSDMIIDALAEDTSKAGADATKGLNYFKGLKSKIEGMITDTGGDPSKAGATLIGVSNNIAYADKDNVSKIMVDGSNKAVEPGIIDAIKTTIKLESIAKNLPSTGMNTYYFTITTVGYYRSNMITVQDLIYAEAGSATPKGNNLFSTFFTATGQELKSGNIEPTSRCVVIDTQQISDNTYFQNEFTFITGGNTDCAFQGGLKTTGGLYIKKVQNYHIPKPTDTQRYDWIIGGDMYLGEEITLDLNGNDLFVHGDLYIQNGHALSAGNIYVEGNIYMLNGDGDFNLTGGTARLNTQADGTTPIANGLFVKGGIYSKPTNTTKTGNSEWGHGKSIIAQKAGVDLENLTIKDEFETLNKIYNEFMGSGGYMNYGTSGNTPEVTGGTLYIQSGKQNDTNIASPTALPNWDDLKVKINEQAETAEEYVDKIQETSVDSLLDTKGGMQRIDYISYSSDQTTYNNVVSLDFSAVSSTVEYDHAYVLYDDGHGNQATITYPDPNPGDTEIQKPIGNCSDFILDLPYIKGGYLLEYTNLSDGKIPMDPNASGGTVRIKTPNEPQKDAAGNIMYMTETVTKPDGTTEEVIAKDKDGNKIPVPETMPIVLAGNFNDGSTNPAGKNSDGKTYNAFRWTAGQSSNSGLLTVELVDKDDVTKSAVGNVVFEMASYDKDGKYGSYDPNKSVDCITYWAKQKEKVGTLNQVTNISSLQVSKPQDSDQYKFLKTVGGKVTNDVQDKYDNKIILVSNKNNCKNAFNATGGDSTFCGYLYAPNGTFDAWQDKSTMPLFGGMIISDYKVKLGSYLYAEPDPKLIAALGKTLKGKNGSGDKPTVSKTTWHADIGKNYLG